MRKLLSIIFTITLVGCSPTNRGTQHSAITETPTADSVPGTQPTAAKEPEPQEIQTEEPRPHNEAVAYAVDGIQFKLCAEWTERTAYEFTPNETGRFARENLTREPLGNNPRIFSVGITEKETALETVNGISERYKGLYERELELDAPAAVLQWDNGVLPNLRHTTVVIIKDKKLYEITYDWDIRSQEEFNDLEMFLESITVN
jgi:hypothetical protein